MEAVPAHKASPHRFPVCRAIKSPPLQLHPETVSQFHGGVAHILASTSGNYIQPSIGAPVYAFSVYQFNRRANRPNGAEQYIPPPAKWYWIDAQQHQLLQSNRLLLSSSRSPLQSHSPHSYWPILFFSLQHLLWLELAATIRARLGWTWRGGFGRDVIHWREGHSNIIKNDNRWPSAEAIVTDEEVMAPLDFEIQ